jgi:hypothetical protein
MVGCGVLETDLADLISNDSDSLVVWDTARRKMQDSKHTFSGFEGVYTPELPAVQVRLAGYVCEAKMLCPSVRPSAPIPTLALRY